MVEIPSSFTKEAFHQWRHSAIGECFFAILDDYVREVSVAVVAQIGASEDSLGKEFTTAVRNAGHITGVQHAIDFDPFEEEGNESTSDGG